MGGVPHRPDVPGADPEADLEADVEAVPAANPAAVPEADPDAGEANDGKGAESEGGRSSTAVPHREPERSLIAK